MKRQQTHTEPRPSPRHPLLPERLRRALWRLLPLIGGLHAYIGWRLLAALDLGAGGLVLAIGGLMICAVLVPFGLLARFVVDRPALADRLTWLGGLAMGLFSSLLVLTALRDVVRLFADSPSLAQPTAVAVVVLAGAFTLVGYVNARRVARVVEVDVPLAKLPPALAGFTIVQLSDIHVGPTIKREYVQAIVDRVNQLDADLIAITGDVVDGSVEHLRAHKVSRSYCANPAVNAAVCHYAGIAQQAGITTEISLDIAADLDVDMLELSMVVANLMENAIHGCGKLAQDRKPYIRFICRSVGRLLLEIENPCSDDATLDENGYPVTRREGHGIGSRSVVAFAKKNDAELLYRIENGVFRVRLLV